MESSAMRFSPISADLWVTREKQVWRAELVRPELEGRPPILMVIDVHARRRLLTVLTAALAEDIASALDRLCRRAGRPEEIWIDQGFEFCPALWRLSEQYGVTIVHIPPTPQWRAISEPIVRNLRRHISRKRHPTLTALNYHLKLWRQSYTPAARPHVNK
jgi:hypothetical protein